MATVICDDCRRIAAPESGLFYPPRSIVRPETSMEDGIQVAFKPSFKALEHSAAKGCSFCQFFIDTAPLRSIDSSHDGALYLRRDHYSFSERIPGPTLCLLSPGVNRQGFYNIYTTGRHYSPVTTPRSLTQ